MRAWIYIVITGALLGCARSSSISPTLALDPISNGECTQMYSALQQLRATDSTCQSDSDCVLIPDSYATCTNQMDSFNRNANTTAFMTAEAAYASGCQADLNLSCMNYVTPNAVCSNNSCTFGN